MLCLMLLVLQFWLLQLLLKLWLLLSPSVLLPLSLTYCMFCCCSCTFGDDGDDGDPHHDRDENGDMDVSTAIIAATAT